MEFAVYTISVSGLFRKTYSIHEDDTLVYTAESASFWSSREIIFWNGEGREVLFLKRTSTLLSTQFIIYQESQAIATVVKKGMGINFYSDSIYGQHRLHGKKFNSDITIFDGDDEIAKVSRKKFRSKDKYGIAIKKGHNEGYILAMVIAVEIVIQMQQNG